MTSRSHWVFHPHAPMYRYMDVVDRSTQLSNEEGHHWLVVGGPGPVWPG